MKLFVNLRFWILVSSAVIAAVLNFYVKTTVPTEQAQIVMLTQFYALIAVVYLYFTLLTSPLTQLFTFLPFRSNYIYARQALGVSAWMFALLHVYYGFFGELGGFEGLAYLNIRYLTAVGLGTVSLVILTFMTLSSMDWLKDRLTLKKIKFIHNFIYLGSFLLVIHALMLGSHFTDFSESIPQIFSVALIFLVILEATRLDNYLSVKLIYYPKAGPVALIALLLTVSLIFSNLAPGNLRTSLSLHEQHKKMALETKTNSELGVFSKMPGMQGDRTKRYSVDWDFEKSIEVGQGSLVKFRIFDASNGQPVVLLTKNYEKLVHLIVVDSGLETYQHIHPEFNNGWFEIPVIFPKEGRYHLYLDFVPTGAIEQQIAATIRVGEIDETNTVVREQEEKTLKSFDRYNVELLYNKPLTATRMSLGEEKLSYRLTDLTGSPVKTLKPYLGSFGHLVMINTQTYEYIHVHPVQIGNLLPDQNGGPVVEFMPIGIYSPIKAGTYKLFAQFNPDNKLITTDFTIKVE